MSNYEICEESQRYIPKEENKVDKEIHPTPGDSGAESRRDNLPNPTPMGDDEGSSDGGLMKLLFFGIAALSLIGLFKYIRSIP